MRKLPVLSLAVACTPAVVGDETDETGTQGDDTAAVDTAAVDTGEAPWAAPGSDCALTSDLTTPWFTEGDAVAFTIACTGELSTDDAIIEPLRQPSGATVDGLDFAWQTGPADGGRVDVVFSVQPRSDPDAVPSAETITFWVADEPADPDNVPVDPATYTEEWGLPVVHIDYDGGLSTGYTTATVTFMGHAYDANVKIRGATSAYYPKPPLTLEFNDEEIAIDTWDVTRDHLVLMTTFDDNSYVRQKLIYDQWAAIADYWGEDRLTPRTFFAVVYLEGAYWGLYVALDRIDNEFLDHMGFDRDANLYKGINHDANFALTNSYGSTKSSLHEGYTKEEGEPEGDFSDLDALVQFTGGSGPEALVEGADDWIQLTEFMDWFLLVHYSLSSDSAGKNSYLYNVPAETGFRYVPWDFNHAWGQGWYTYRTSSSELDYYTSRNRVFWAIQTVDTANAEQWDRFSQMREDGPFAPEWLEHTVDDYYALIEPSAQRDWAMWEASYRTYGGWASYRASAGDWTDYEGERAYLYQWLDERAALFWDNHP